MDAVETWLEVRDLRVAFGKSPRRVQVVEGVCLDVPPGAIVALVGESGSGKSVTALALGGLLPPSATVEGRIRAGDCDVTRAGPDALRRLRGGGLAYIFQEPGSALNPVLRIGTQLREAVRLHQPTAGPDEIAVALLARCGLPDPRACLDAWPHELSGGMQQRAMIAMALACRPRLLVADEPTTALDVTIQAQILDLLVDLRASLGMAILLITHNLGIVAGVADTVYVFYAGQVVESGPVGAVLGAPAHPYTRALLDAAPTLAHGAVRVQGIPGAVPDPACPPSGCRFHPRCPFAQARCREQSPPPLRPDATRTAWCHFPLVDAPR